MANPVRTTDNPLGRKLLQVLDERGTPGDLAALAAAFDVAVPSTYDWINHGRMSKERFARLVEWSGKDLHWWFDVPAPIISRTAAAHEQIAAYTLPWPFPRVPERAIRQLAPSDLATLEGILLGALSVMAVSRSPTGAA